MKVKGRKAMWMDSTLRTLGVLCFGEFSKVLNVRKPFPLVGLLKQNVILELDALTSADKTFFIEALLLWIHHYRLAEKHREVFKHAVFIEEAHQILLRKKQEMTGTEAVTDIILREIRELGESIVLIDQHPSLISMPALGNTYTTICLGLKHRADMRTISESLLLEKEQVDFLGQLETGTAICKLQGRYFRPFVVEFPLFPLKKGMVADEEVKRKMGSCSEGKEDVRDDESSMKPVSPPQGEVKKEEKEVILTGKERDFMVDIAKNPVSGVVARYTRMGINRYQGNKIQKSLLDKNLISWKPVSTAKGRLKVLVLTDKGKKSIPEVRIDKVFSKQGSWEHEYWKYRVGEYYREKGYKVTFEYKIGEGKSVDLVAEKDGKMIAIEIETGKSDAVYNVRKDLEAGFDEVVVAALSNEISKKILVDLKESELDKSEKIKVIKLDMEKSNPQ